VVLRDVRVLSYGNSKFRVVSYVVVHEGALNCVLEFGLLPPTHWYRQVLLHCYFLLEFLFAHRAFDPNFRAIKFLVDEATICESCSRQNVILIKLCPNLSMLLINTSAWHITHLEHVLGSHRQLLRNIIFLFNVIAMLLLDHWLFLV
jgi:hypothetical protein